MYGKAKKGAKAMKKAGKKDMKSISGIMKSGGGRVTL